MVPTPMLYDPRLHVSYRPTWWHDTHPLHIRKTSHFTLATRELDRARDLYLNVIGGTLLHEGEDDLLRTRSAYVAVGRDDVVELAEPLEAGTPIADYVEANHHGLFAVWLQVEDLAEDLVALLAAEPARPGGEHRGHQHHAVHLVRPPSCEA